MLLFSVWLTAAIYQWTRALCLGAAGSGNLQRTRLRTTVHLGIARRPISQTAHRAHRHVADRTRFFATPDHSVPLRSSDLYRDTHFNRQRQLRFSCRRRSGQSVARQWIRKQNRYLRGRRRGRRDDRHRPRHRSFRPLFPVSLVARGVDRPPVAKARGHSGAGSLFQRRPGIHTLHRRFFSDAHNRYGITLSPLQSLDSARTAKVPGSLAVIATLFFFVQTLFIPSPAALAVRPDFTVLPLPTMFIFILATLLTASRLVGGFITYRLSATPFMLLAAFSTLPLLIPTGKSLWGIFLQAFALGVPTAWAAFQYYRVMPNRPALAYSLQKLPMFAAAFLLVIQQVLPISGHAVFGGTLLRNTMLILTWTSMLIIWIVCQRKNLKMEGI